MSQQVSDVGGTVLCVTPNVALDVTYRAASVETGDANRVEPIHTQAGGKGVNVARILKSWGCEPRVLGFSGGRVGDEIIASLQSGAVSHDLVTCHGDSRRTVTVVSATDGMATGF